MQAIDAILRTNHVARARTPWAASCGVDRAVRPGCRFTAAGPPDDREREVLQLLTEGKVNKAEIAALLRIGVKTAETHRARMMAKLGLHSIE